MIPSRMPLLKGARLGPAAQPAHLLGCRRTLDGTFFGPEEKVGRAKRREEVHG